MAWRLRLVPARTSIDFFRWQGLTFGLSIAAMLASVILVAVMGINFGIDFRGGTSIRTEAVQPVNVAAYRAALEALGHEDVTITEVFDPAFRADQNVAQVRIAAEAGGEAATPQKLAAIEAALQGVDPTLRFTAVESVGPKVSAELIRSAILAVLAASLGILFYVWVRFEWQFAVGSVAALIHDIVLTIGIFALLQIRFDLTTVAALLTILGYSINDTVVVFDRLRENLIKYKSMPLREVMNLSVNETLSRTFMTAGSTLLALGALLVFGGDVIRGFVFGIFFGVIVGTYSSIYMAKNIVLYLGIRRDWGEARAGEGGTQFRGGSTP